MGKAPEGEVFPNSISEQFTWEALAATFSTMNKFILHPGTTNILSLWSCVCYLTLNTSPFI